ncbi:MAG: class I SAM-dependent methyltransferase [Spirochaetaceae bacterium]|jgi:23S rRNA G2069 N7-methylase RlmK/C1962 C5-methylase RlmI|nr:class I SAM-dependent methyltransferase [Spirochaetaceae bacterium]
MDVHAKTAYQAQLLENRLRKRDRHLRKWARRTGTDVYRLYDRDIPEIPLTLDRYGGAAAGALYERPYGKDEAEEERWLAAMTEAVSRSLEIAPQRIFLKRRRRQRGRQKTGGQYEKLADQSFLAEVHEGGLRFRVNLSDYLDTGFFPDRRILRDMIRGEAAGKRVLNLFCYTGAFSVYAASGGAAAADSVDISKTYLSWAASNMAQNGIEAGFCPPEAVWRPAGAGWPALPVCRLIRADALAFLDGAARRRCSWDVIILDPPTFSNSKKMRTALDIRRDYSSLIRHCLGLLNPGGVLWFSVSARRFRLEPDEFPGAVCADMSRRIADEDFRGKRPPVCYRFSC